MTPDRFAALSQRVEKILEKQVFFVMGAPKSGTTWLQLLLDAHPQVLCSGEGHFADLFAKDLTQLVRNYNKKFRIVDNMVYQGRNTTYQPVDVEIFDFLCLGLIGTMLSQRGVTEAVRCVGDKTPRSVFFAGFLHRLLPKARFLHIVRDCHDVVISQLHHARRAGAADALTADSDTQQKLVERYAHNWAHSVSTAAVFEKEHPGVCHTLRFEDLHQDPDRVMKQLFAFLGVENTPGVRQHCQDATRFERLSGGRKRGEEEALAFFRKGVVGDGRARLSQVAKAILRTQAAQSLKDHGYAAD